MLRAAFYVRSTHCDLVMQTLLRLYLATNIHSIYVFVGQKYTEMHYSDPTFCTAAFVRMSVGSFLACVHVVQLVRVATLVG